MAMASVLDCCGATWGRDPRSGGEVRAIAASLARSLHLAPTLHRGQVGEKEKQVKKLQKALRQIEELKLKQNQGVQVLYGPAFKL